MRAPRFDDQSVTLVVASYTTDSGLRSHEMTLDDFLARAALDGMKATRWFVHGVVVDRHGRVLGAADVLPSVAAAATTPELHLRARGIEAIGSETTDGFVVRAGSRAALTPVPSFPDYARKRREDLAARRPGARWTGPAPHAGLRVRVALDRGERHARSERQRQGGVEGRGREASEGPPGASDRRWMRREVAVAVRSLGSALVVGMPRRSGGTR